MQHDDYVKKNDWFFTASKLKVYKRNPEEYFLQYVQKIYIEQTGKHFMIGTALDDLLTYRIDLGSNTKYTYEVEAIKDWNEELMKETVIWFQKKMRANDVEDWQEWIQKRLSKYYIEEWLVVAELKSKLKRRPLEKRFWYNDYAINNLKLPELRAIYYTDTEQKKIRITPSEWKIIMGMYREVLKQPRMDPFGRRWTQARIEAEYKWHQLRGALDRLVFVDKAGNRYLPDEVDEYIETYGRDKRLELVKDEGIYSIIRDRKTTYDIVIFVNQIKYEDPFDYLMSMSFYYMLTLMKYWTKSRVFLDAIWKKDPYWSWVAEIQLEDMIWSIRDVIKPLLDDLIRAYEDNMREPVEPLTWMPITRTEMMKSRYYPYMKWAVQKDIDTFW